MTVRPNTFVTSNTVLRVVDYIIAFRYEVSATSKPPVFATLCQTIYRMEYTWDKLVDMPFVYWQTNRNSNLLSRLCAETYPTWRCSAKGTFVAINQLLREFDTFQFLTTYYATTRQIHKSEVEEHATDSITEHPVTSKQIFQNVWCFVHDCVENFPRTSKWKMNTDPQSSRLSITVTVFSIVTIFRQVKWSKVLFLCLYR